MAGFIEDFTTCRRFAREPQARLNPEGARIPGGDQAWPAGVPSARLGSAIGSDTSAGTSSAFICAPLISPAGMSMLFAQGPHRSKVCRPPRKRLDHRAFPTSIDVARSMCRQTHASRGSWSHLRGPDIGRRSDGRAGCQRQYRAESGSRSLGRLIAWPHASPCRPWWHAPAW